MSKRDPDSPSLALCGICRFSGDYKTLDISVGGGLDLFPTCEHYALDRTCPGFAPGNIKGLTLQDQAKMMMEMAQFGRFQA